MGGRKTHPKVEILRLKFYLSHSAVYCQSVYCQRGPPAATMDTPATASLPPIAEAHQPTASVGSISLVCILCLEMPRKILYETYIVFCKALNILQLTSVLPATCFDAVLWPELWLQWQSDQCVQHYSERHRK